MSRRHSTEFRGACPSPQFPPDRVLNSGSVVFPGAFDQHGCLLVTFPAAAHGNLTDLSKAEVVDFIDYFRCLLNKKQDKECLVSVVADLRQATLTTTRFIAESIFLLELHKRTVHTMYIIQPKKKDVLKLLLKLLAPSKYNVSPFKRILLKEVFELSNHIDRSQLPASLGGYLVYCHRSWVTFIKEIDAFVREFLSVVQSLPSCISTLQTLSRQPGPSTFSELKDFCSTNEAQFQSLRRELGLDELLRHCESLVEKLRYPENDPCYQAMAGTALYTHTAFDMLQNFSRITAAVEKIELLWQQAFSKAHLQLRVFQLSEEAQKITEQMNSLQEEKLQPYRIEIAKDSGEAETLMSEFESSVYTHAMALVRRSADVIHTLMEILPLGDARTREEWVRDLNRLKENFSSAVAVPHQTLKAVSDFYNYHSKASGWYKLVLCENFLQDLLWGESCDRPSKQRHSLEARGPVPVWRQVVRDFLREKTSPAMEELLQLAHLASVLPDAQLQQTGKRLAQRCIVLRKLLTSPAAVPISDLQLALQWQYEFLSGSHQDVCGPHTNRAADRDPGAVLHSPDGASHSLASDRPSKNDPMCSHGSVSNLRQRRAPQGRSPSSGVSGMAIGKPPSLGSFDSGFDGAGGSHVEIVVGKEGWDSRVPGTRDPFRPLTRQPQIHEENISSVSDSDDHGGAFGSVADTPEATVQIIPKISLDSLNFEIKLKRSAALPQNPWLSLPVDDLENSYTVTITQNPSRHKQGACSPNPSESSHRSDRSSTRSRDQPTQTEVHMSPESSGEPPRDGVLHSPDSFEELSPIRNVLSSTITESRDLPNFTAERPTLLWDTYDFHDPEHNTCERITSSMADDSLSDWDLKEQEDLREVEVILERTAGILEEEENVIAQEYALDVLLKTENTSKPWASWGAAEEMSTSDLKAQGILCMDDSFASLDSDNHSEYRSSEAASVSSELPETELTLPVAPPCNRGELLKELRGLQVLDELIVEENLKIHAFRRVEKESLDIIPPPSAASQSTNAERRGLLLELEREKMEVARMEKDIEKEMMDECDFKKQQSRSGKVVKCSVMERASILKLEDSVLCDELLSDCKCQHPGVKHLQTSSRDTTIVEPKESFCIPATSSAITPVSQGFGQSPHADTGVLSDDDAMEGDTSSGHGVTEPCTALRSLLIPPLSGHDHNERIEDVVIQPCEDTGNCLDLASVESCIQGASPTPEMLLVFGAFDPGGESHDPPLPAQGKASLAPNDNVQLSTLCAVTQQHSVTPKPKGTCLESTTLLHSPVSRPDVKEHCFNCDEPPLVDLGLSLCNNYLKIDELSTLDSLESTLTPDGSDGIQNEMQLAVLTADSQISVLMGDCGSTEVLHCRSAEATTGSCESSRTDDQRAVEIFEFQRCGTARMSPVSQPDLQLTTRDMTNFKTPIVLDTGSGLMKAGFANQDFPSTIFPNIIGLPKYEEVMNGRIEGKTYIGHEAQHMRGVLTLKYPMQNGIIRNWDEMEKIWHHTFQQLRVDPDDHPVLLTEPAMNPLENRQRMVELMFECFNVPLTYVAMQAVLALYTAGRTTGVVLDSGDGVSHSVPVFEGYCLPHAVQRFTLAGQDVTVQLKKLLQEQGVCMRTSAEMEIVREIKEKCCRVSQDYESELVGGKSASSETHYTMPDGQVIRLGTETFRAPEILFKPELIGRDHYGIHESIFKSIIRSDIDLRRSFLGNIVLSGGNTLLAGLPERLHSEIRTMVPRDLADCVRVTSPKDRDFSVWCGGAVLANLTSFGSAWISQEEYEEYGPQIVFRKCF
ncbi:hypothetical protein DPEC_G00083410 [Dallia pectoralis]|uniref:Uncharacterized protein n=1 Tax=Dallia pectoralis TaxID=75939 RepID=A0ACC2H042_DALPE|nr:hypothetical protein DPEC_G00083410 [Dallia pectoralis]